MLIPKKAGRIVHKRTQELINTFIAVHNEILERSFWYHFALAHKIGSPYWV
jgi:hypothetical protein